MGRVQLVDNYRLDVVDGTVRHDGIYRFWGKVAGHYLPQSVVGF